MTYRSSNNLNPDRRRGIALILVTVVLAMAALIAFALISASSIQTSVTGNAGAGGTADGLAESGVNLAVYYLQHPETAPNLTSGHYGGQSSVDLGLGTAGDLGPITVTSLGNNSYRVSSTGGVGSGTNRSTRTLTSTVNVNSKYIIDKAIAANGNVTIPLTTITTFTGDARVDGTYSGSATSITGALLAKGSTLLSWQADPKTPPKYPTTAAPHAAELNLIKSLRGGTLAYKYKGANCTADTIPPAGFTGTVTVPNANNPMAVYYATGNRTISSTTTVNGTIVIDGGTLTINGTTTITAKGDIPALICTGDLMFYNSTRKLTVNGLAWLGGNITLSGSGIAPNIPPYINDQFIVTGALMLDAPDMQVASTMGTVKVTYSATKVAIPDLSDVNQIAQGMKIVSWGK